MEKFLDKMLFNNLRKLNDIEQKKSKIETILFVRETEELKNQKLNSFKENILNQAIFYNQNINNYDQIYHDIIEKYSSQLSNFLNIYIELFINIQMELQETECNQKIAITNLKKCIDLRTKLKNSNLSNEIEQCNKKINACIQKKANYDIIIKNCEKELEECSKKMKSNTNILFGDKSSQIILNDEGGLKKFLNKFINKFTGANKFKNYVIDPANLEIENINLKIPRLGGDVKNNIVNFVAKIKQAKDETNKIFDKMIV